MFVTLKFMLIVSCTKISAFYYYSTTQATWSRKYKLATNNPYKFIEVENVQNLFAALAAHAILCVLSTCLYTGFIGS